MSWEDKIIVTEGERFSLLSIQQADGLWTNLPKLDKEFATQFRQVLLDIIDKAVADALYVPFA